MKFRCAYDPSEHKPNPTGDGTDIVYRREYDQKTKRYKLIASGKTDFYRAIQVAAEGADLKALLTRYINGDEGALGVDSGSYADLTNAPKTLLDAHLKIIDAQKKFDALPLDVKKEFNNSFNEFLSSVGSGDFSKSLSSKISSLQSEKKPPLSPDQITYIKEQLNNA